MTKKLNPEELVAKLKKEVRQVQTGPNRRIVAKVLRQLGPAFGLSNHLVSRVWKDMQEDGDLLEAARRDAKEGHLIPAGLVIGGHKGLTLPDIVSLKFSKKSWWNKLMNLITLHEEVIWVLPVKSLGYWVIHNTTVDPDKRHPAFVIPAIRKGLNHIQVIRLESFVKEMRDEPE